MTARHQREANSEHATTMRGIPLLCQGDQGGMRRSRPFGTHRRGGGRLPRLGIAKNRPDEVIE